MTCQYRTFYPPGMPWAAHPLTRRNSLLTTGQSPATVTDRTFVTSRFPTVARTSQAPLPRGRTRHETPFPVAHRGHHRRLPPARSHNGPWQGLGAGERSSFPRSGPLPLRGTWTDSSCRPVKGRHHGLDSIRVCRSRAKPRAVPLSGRPAHGPVPTLTYACASFTGAPRGQESRAQRPLQDGLRFGPHPQRVGPVHGGLDDVEPRLPPAQAARDLADRRLNDRGLSPTARARKPNVSMCTLQRAFADEGQSLSTCFRKRRLGEGCRGAHRTAPAYDRRP